MIELLVVVLVIAILAAISVPAYLKQREKAFVSQSQQGLKDAATSAEGYALDNSGNYDGVTAEFLRGQGYRGAPNVAITVVGDSDGYCLLATHASLEDEHDHYLSTWDSDHPGPNIAENCVEPPTF